MSTNFNPYQGTSIYSQMGFQTAQFNTQKSVVQNTQSAIPTNVITNVPVLQNSGKGINKRNIITFAGLSSAVVLAASVLFAAKRGKVINEDGGVSAKFIQNITEGFKTFFGKRKENYNSIIEKRKNLPVIEQPSQPVIRRPEEGAGVIQDELARIAEEINNAKPANSIGYKITKACLDETSAQEDISKWVAKVKNAPSEVRKKDSDRVVLNNPFDIDELSKIKPHDYSETSDIFFTTRTYHVGFPQSGFVVKDGEFGTFERGDVLKYIDKVFIGYRESGYGYSAGISKDGRACVVLHFREQRTDRAARPVHTTVLLRSKDGNFTQDQLDAIKLFQNADRNAISGKECPLMFAFMQEEGDGLTGALHLNRNMFLSILQDAADKIKDFDVVKLLKDNGNTVSRIL